MYIMCVCLFSALSRRVGALQISIIIIIIIICVIIKNGTKFGKRIKYTTSHLPSSALRY